MLFEQAGLVGEIQVLQEYPLANHLNWGYRKAPSDTLASRKGIPDIALHPSVPEEKWEQFWIDMNQAYTRFLTENGYGDRLWCVVGTDNHKA